MQKVYERGIKQISVIDMASIVGKQAKNVKSNKQENEQSIACGRKHDKQQDKQTNRKADKARKTSK